jgi:phosphoglycolate phosphatase
LPELSGSGPAAPPVVVFDIDGTLLDSASGIVAGFQHALRSVGFEPPDQQVLRSDLGPPVGQVFTALGLPTADLATAVLAYRTFYLERGLQQSAPYAGVLELLDTLRTSGVTLATATAKRTEVARAIVAHHGLDSYFAVVNGTDDQRHTKTATLAHTLELLGNPPRESVVMVGDRHSDVTAGVDCGVLAVGVTWGYGSRAELEATGARLIDQPAALLDLPVLQQRLAVTSH